MASHACSQTHCHPAHPSDDAASESACSTAAPLPRDLRLPAARRVHGRLDTVEDFEANNGSGVLLKNCLQQNDATADWPLLGVLPTRPLSCGRRLWIQSLESTLVGSKAAQSQGAADHLSCGRWLWIQSIPPASARPAARVGCPPGAAMDHENIRIDKGPNRTASRSVSDVQQLRWDALGAAAKRKEKWVGTRQTTEQHRRRMAERAGHAVQSQWRKTTKLRFTRANSFSNRLFCQLVEPTRNHKANTRAQPTCAVSFSSRLRA